MANNNQPDTALLDYLPKDLILARYQLAAGKELTSGKFSSPESSSALVANAFGFFASRPDLLALPEPALEGGEAIRVELEAEMRFPWSGGRHPWLDVVVETKDRLIGIESKRYEPFRGSKLAMLSDAYGRPVWGEAMKPYEAMRDALRDGRTFVRLDAAQLVKHAFGLRTQAVRAGKTAVLCYLYAEPTKFPGGRTIAQAELDLHRHEITQFKADVSDGDCEVAFTSFTYADLLKHWQGLPLLAAHAAAMSARFDVGPVS